MGADLRGGRHIACPRVATSTLTSKSNKNQYKNQFTSWFLIMVVNFQIHEVLYQGYYISFFKINYLHKSIGKPPNVKNQVKFWLIFQSSTFLFRLLNICICKNTKTWAEYINTHPCSQLFMALYHPLIKCSLLIIIFKILHFQPQQVLLHFENL